MVAGQSGTSRRNAKVKQRVERQIGDHVLSIETGFLAKQAAGSVLVSYGETVVLVASATGAPRHAHPHRL